MNELQIVTTRSMLAPASYATTGAVAAAAAVVDMLPYEGMALVALSKGVGTGTLDVKLQDSPDGTNDWQDMSVAFAQAGTGAGLQTRTVNVNAQRRFWRCVGTIATGPHLASITLHARPKYL